MPGTSAILCTGDTCRFASLKHIPLHPKWCPRCQKACLLGFGGNWNSVGQSAKMFESNPFKSCVSILGVGESNGTHVCHFVLPFSGWLAFLFLGDPRSPSTHLGEMSSPRKLSCGRGRWGLRQGCLRGADLDFLSGNQLDLFSIQWDISGIQPGINGDIIWRDI